MRRNPLNLPLSENAAALKEGNGSTRRALKLAIMQPYILPYLGYFQLMAAVDRFVIYDDVAFIKGGWINRNRILLDGRDHLFALPLRRASQNRLINQISLVAETDWPEKLLKTLRHAYRRAPYFGEFFPLAAEIVRSAERNLANYLRQSLFAIKNYLAIQTTIIPTSAVYENRHLKGEARILDICRQEGATTYLNPSGGEELYNPDTFHSTGVALHFLEATSPAYQQFGQPFVPRLSIVDALMFNPPAKVRSWLSARRIG